MTTTHEQLIEVWRIAERRDGATYRTEYVEERWVPIGARPEGDEVFVPLSNPPVGQPLFRVAR